MLDAYIIDRIQRERERARHRDGRIPLHIEPPRGERPPGEDVPRERDEDKQDRGAVIIDFQV